MFERKLMVLLAAALSLLIAAGVLAIGPNNAILAVLPAGRPDVRLELHGAVRRGAQLLSVEKANPIGHGDVVADNTGRATASRAQQIKLRPTLSPHTNQNGEEQ